MAERAIPFHEQSGGLFLSLKLIIFIFTGALIVQKAQSPTSFISGGLKNQTKPSYHKFQFNVFILSLSKLMR